MERPLKIGIVCFPLIGGSGILATALGTELAARGHEVHFFSHAKPVRLDLSLPRIHFHEVEVGHATVFPCPDYTLPLAVKMAEVGQAKALDVFHVHYAVPHATAAFLATEMIGKGAPKVITTLHGTDTTLLGPNPQYRAAIEHALIHSDAVTTVSESLRRQTEEIFQLRNDIIVIPNFFTPNATIRSRDEVRRELGINEGEFLVVHMSNLACRKSACTAGGRCFACSGLRWMPLPSLAVTRCGNTASSPESLLAKIAPKMATPKEPPTERENVAVEVATPISDGCASFWTTSTSTCITRPIPTPTTSM